MTVTVTRQTINDGPRNLVVKCHLVSNDTANASGQLLIDVSTYGGAPSDVKIVGIKATLAGFAVDLHWDADTDVDIISIPDAEDFNQCYRRFGGLINNAGTGKTGDIMFSTRDIGSGDEGTIILDMKKRAG